MYLHRNLFIHYIMMF